LKITFPSLIREKKEEGEAKPRNERDMIHFLAIIRIEKVSRKSI